MSKVAAAIAAHKVVAAISALTLITGAAAGATVVVRSASKTSAASSFDCPVPGSHPKFIAIMLQGVSSYVLTNPDINIPHEGTSFNAAQASYCATSPNDKPQSNGALPPNNSNAVLRSMADGWLNYTYPGNGAPFSNGTGVRYSTDASTVYSGGDDLINKLALAGGYVLPYSYCCLLGSNPVLYGAGMTGSAAKPMFTFFSYDGKDVASGDPQLGDPPLLNQEIASIHKIFPSVPIVLIGHSNGGLVAEQWWLRWGTKQGCGNFSNGPAAGQPQCGMHGVAHVFTLDSPINGVYFGDDCDQTILSAGGDPVGYVIGQIINSLCSSTVGTTMGAEYTDMWEGNIDGKTTLPGGVSVSNDFAPGDLGEGDLLIAYLDTTSRQLQLPSGYASYYFPGFNREPGTFTAEGTYGDPLFDAADPPNLIDRAFGASHWGILAQIVFTPTCLADFTPVTESECAPQKGDWSSTVPPLDYISTCAHGYNSPSQTSPSNQADGQGNDPTELYKLIPFLGPVVDSLLSHLPFYPSFLYGPTVDTYGLTDSPSSIYIHSEAKDCPGTVNMITNYVETLQPKLVAHPKVPLPAKPSVTALAAWINTETGPAAALPQLFQAVINDLPASDAAQIRELEQLASLSGTDTAAFQEATRDIVALKTFFGTPAYEPFVLGPLQAWLASGDEYSDANAIPVALRQAARDLPSPDSAQIAKLNQLAALFRAVGVRTPSQEAQAQADIAALDTFFGTPQFSPFGF
jgi:hypothetical protein